MAPGTIILNTGSSIRISTRMLPAGYVTASRADLRTRMISIFRCHMMWRGRTVTGAGANSGCLLLRGFCWPCPEKEALQQFLLRVLNHRAGAIFPEDASQYAADFTKRCFTFYGFNEQWH